MSPPRFASDLPVGACLSVLVPLPLPLLEAKDLYGPQLGWKSRSVHVRDFAGHAPINHVTAIAVAGHAGKCYGAVCVGIALGPDGVKWKRMSHSLGTL